MPNHQNKTVLTPSIVQSGQAGFSSPLFSLPALNSSSNALSFGQVIQLDSNFTGQGIAVKELTSTSDIPYGITLLDHFREHYLPNEMLPIAIEGTIVYCISGGAIPLGSPVAWDVATNKAIASDGTNPNIGIALNHTDVADDFIEIQIRL